MKKQFTFTASVPTGGGGRKASKKEGASGGKGVSAKKSASVSESRPRSGSR